MPGDLVQPATTCLPNWPAEFHRAGETKHKVDRKQTVELVGKVGMVASEVHALRYPFLSKQRTNYFAKVADRYEISAIATLPPPCSFRGASRVKFNGQFRLVEWTASNCSNARAAQ